MVTKTHVRCGKKKPVQWYLVHRCALNISREKSDADNRNYMYDYNNKKCNYLVFKYNNSYA